MEPLLVNDLMSCGGMLIDVNSFCLLRPNSCVEALFCANPDDMDLPHRSPKAAGPLFRDSQQGTLSPGSAFFPGSGCNNNKAQDHSPRIQSQNSNNNTHHNITTLMDNGMTNNTKKVTFIQLNTEKRHDSCNELKNMVHNFGHQQFIF